MNKLLIVTPNDSIYNAAVNIISEADVDARVIKASSANVVEMVKKEFEGNAGIIVARGHQAQLLKTETNIPVVDIVLTGQDMAELLKKACRMVKHPNPRVAFVGIRHMFSDCTAFADILGADVQIFYAACSADLPKVVEQAILEMRAECIIGGEIACQAAEDLGVQSLFMDSATESIRYAIRTAVRMMDALRAEQEKSAEYKSLLNYSFDAILRLDKEGNILFVNSITEHVLHCTEDTLIDQNFLAIPGLQTTPGLQEAMNKQKDLYSVIIRIKNESFVTNIATISVNGKMNGFTVSMRPFSKITDLEETIRQSRLQQGYKAKAHFSDIHTLSPVMTTFLEDAVQYAMYDVPVLIRGAPGSDLRRIAECIHNGSTVRDNPFVYIDLSIIPSASQMITVFSGDGVNRTHVMMDIASKGTVYFENIQMMTEECQRQLLNILTNGCYQRNNGQYNVSITTRVICSTCVDLESYVKEGRFLAPLYRRLKQIQLNYPSLCEIPEDIPHLLDNSLDAAALRYKKQVSLTPEAITLLMNYDWPGNQEELDALCVKAIMLAHTTRADVNFVKEHLLPKSYKSPESQLFVVSNREELALRTALQECGNDRALAAKQLGVSRSTLWRRMKKYGVEG